MYFPRDDGLDVDAVGDLPLVKAAIIAIMSRCLVFPPGELPLHDDVAAIAAAVAYLVANYPLDETTLWAAGHADPDAPPRPAGVAAPRIPRTQSYGWSFNLVELSANALARVLDDFDIRLPCKVEPWFTPGDDRLFVTAVIITQFANARARGVGDTGPVMGLRGAASGYLSYLAAKYVISQARDSFIQFASPTGMIPDSQPDWWYHLVRWAALTYELPLPELLP